MLSWLLGGDCKAFVEVDALAWIGEDSWRVVEFCSGWVRFDP